MVLFYRGVTFMKRMIVPIALIVAGLLFVGTAQAIDLNNSNNGAGSNNSVNVQQSQSTTVQQQNSADITNEFDVNQNTGGNSASGNNGNATIETGDTSATFKVTNTFNMNNAEVGCCDQNGPTPTTKPVQPTPTPKPGAPGPGEAVGGASSPGSSGGSGGGGQVLGLPPTSGEWSVLDMVSMIGIICVALGSVLLRKNRRVA